MGLRRAILREKPMSDPFDAERWSVLFLGRIEAGTPGWEDCVQRRREMGSVTPPGQIALEPERATLESDFSVGLSLSDFFLTKSEICTICSY
jgi:hypothetical protein